MPDSVFAEIAVTLLPGDVLFDSGRDDLKAGGLKILLQVADVIQNDSALRDRHKPGAPSVRLKTNSPFTAA